MAVHHIQYGVQPYFPLSMNHVVGQVYKVAKRKLEYLISTEHTKVLCLHFCVFLMSENVIKKMIEGLYMPGAAMA